MQALPSLSSLIRPNEQLHLRAWRTERARIVREHTASLPTSGRAPKSFQELTGLPQTTPGYAEHAGYYHKFLASVSAALGGEAPSDEVAHAA